MALGATASWVVKAFVGEGLVLAGVGLALGIAGSGVSLACCRRVCLA